MVDQRPSAEEAAPQENQYPDPNNVVEPQRHALHVVATRRLRVVPFPTHVLWPQHSCEAFKEANVVTFCDWLHMFAEHAETAPHCCQLQHMACLKFLTGALNRLNDPAAMRKLLYLCQAVAREPLADVAVPEDDLFPPRMPQ